MVGNRPVVGVRNPVCSAFPASYFRAKNIGAGSPQPGQNSSGTTDSGNPHLILAMSLAMTSEPKLLEAAPHY
jgi:hypothetical protein